jgi:heme exporter protein CcmD
MPDNASYMHAAYAISAAAYVFYAVSVWRRRREVERRLRELERGEPRR